MTIEDKKLLFRDLCARLPYGVIIQHPALFYSSKMVVEKLTSIDNEHINDDGLPIEYVKPYLRPMSSMTEEEKDFIRNRYFFEDWNSWNDLLHYHWHQINVEEIPEFIDWLNEHHFDFRGLIEKGLALEAPDGMYKF